MSVKPNNIYPRFMRRLLKKVLPSVYYRKYVGRHEDESMRRWIHVSSKMNQNDAVLDIGAFDGEYAIAARKANNEMAIYAFEPNPNSIQRLYRNCRHLKIEVENYAVSDYIGQVLFCLNAAKSRIATAIREKDSETINVEAITLDKWVDEKQVSPTLIKIDTEGAEARILKGALTVLHKFKPIILCEVLTDEAGQDVMAVLPPNYRYFYIDENRGIEQKPCITRKVWRNHNWLLVPKERMPEILI